MLIPIGKVTKELGIPTHQLHTWEEREWLGDVWKDPENNNQRTYTEEQIERIHFIHETIQQQREAGFKKTNIQEMNEALLEKFGGEVTKKQTEVVVHPASIEQIAEMISLQNKKIMELQEALLQHSQKEPPTPIDYSQDLSEVKNQLKFSQEREEKLIGLIEKLQSDVEELKKMPPKDRWKFWKR